MNNNLILEAQNLHKIYNNNAKNLHVLKGIDITVERGENLVIVGPSGAGKSTLLHLLGGLDKPTKGKVLFEGIDIYSASDEKKASLRNKRIGFVFQFYHLLPEFSALENVIMPALINPKNTNKNGIFEKGRELLAKVGIEKRATHRPSELSGGEQQRLAIARALINQPDILFCDEPTGNLDSTTGEEICNLLWNLNKDNNQTLVIVTHEKELASKAKRVLKIQDGKLYN